MRVKAFILSCSLLLCSAVSSIAAPLTTVEWDTKPGAPWSYSGTVVDCAVTPSPSGGCALKFTYPAGTYTTSFGGGRAVYTASGNPTTIYMGSWMRYSSGFQFHQIGQKVNLFYLAGPIPAGSNNGCRNTAFGFAYAQYSATPQICWGGGTYNNFANKSVWDETAHTNEWFWFEIGYTLNTPGQANGIARIWINDVLHLEYTNIKFRDTGDNAGLGDLQNSAEYGGGGSTISSTQYWWIDHTVIDTVRIGMPGGSIPNPDTTPPPVPSAPAIPSSGRPATITWTAVSNAAGDLAGYNLFRKYEPCSSGTALSAVSPVLGNVLTYQDNTVPVGITAMCYAVASRDVTGNISAQSPTTQEVFSSTSPILASNQMDGTGASFTFNSAAYKLRYWDDTSDAFCTSNPGSCSNNRIEVTGLGGVLSYRLSNIWTSSITYMCAEAQGLDGVWETTNNPSNYGCDGFTWSSSVLAPSAPTGLRRRR